MSISPKNKSTRKSNRMVLMMLGFFVLSPISSNIFQKILGFPLILPELLFIPFYIYLKDKMNFQIKRNVFFVGMIIIGILFSLALFIGNYSFYSISSTTRGYIYILLTFSIYRNKKIDIGEIMFIAFGSTLGWMINCLISFKALISNTLLEGQSMAVYGNMISLSLFISIPLIFRWNKYVFLSILTGILLSLMAGLRRELTVFFTSTFFSFFVFLKHFDRKIINTLLLLTSFVIMTIFLYKPIEESIYRISPAYHTRLFTKSESLLSGNSSEGDETRINSFSSFLNSIDDYILPKGFVSKRTLIDEGTGLYMDSPYVELVYTIGILGAVLFIILLLRRLFFHVKNYYVNNVTESGVCIVSIVIICVLLSIEGSFLNYTFTVPFTGFILGRIFSNYNLSKS